MQKNTSVVRTPGLVVRAVCGIALAGACMIAPASALAAGSSPAADVSASAAATASSSSKAASAASEDAQLVSFGGLALQVPSDWMTLRIGDTMSVSTSPDATVSASIVVSDVDGLPSDADGMLAFANTAASDAAKGMGAASTEAQAVTLSDGTQGYAYALQVKDGGTTTKMLVMLVPMGADKLGVVTLTCDDGSKDGEQVADAISESITLADAKGAATDAKGASSGAASVTLGQTVEAGGLALDLPADMNGDGDAETPAYVNTDGTFVVMVFPGMAEDVSELTTDILDQAAVTFVQELDGEVMGSTETTLAETTVYSYAFSCVDDGTPMLGGISFVPVADGSLTAVLTACAAEDSATYGPVMDAIIEGIQLA